MPSQPAPTDPLDRAIAALGSLQTASGSWKGDYSGPLFLLPMYVAACRVTGAMRMWQRRPKSLRRILMCSSARLMITGAGAAMTRSRN